MTMHQMEGSRTFSMAESRSCTPRPQCLGGGLQRAALDHFDSHGKEGTTGGKGALSLLGGTRTSLKTASSWRNAQGERARLSGLEELMVVKPREHLAKIVMQDSQGKDHRRTPQEVVARARKHAGIPKGTQRARKMLRGEADPKGFGYIEFRDEGPVDRAGGWGSTTSRRPCSRPRGG